MSNSLLQPRVYDPSTYWTTRARDFRFSSRLHLQHQIWQNTVVWVMNYCIEMDLRDQEPTVLEPVRIADLGCGNGAWLTHLSQNFQDYEILIHAKLVGYDISDQNFPPRAFVPDNVRLKKLDILSPTLPTDVVGAFDVVHIRAFAGVVLNNDPSSVLNAAMTMLKPGGYIQWDEMGPQLYIEPASSRLSTIACQTMARLVKAGGNGQVVKRGFVMDLDSHMEAAGFVDTSKYRHRKRKQDYQGWTEVFLAAWEEIAEFLPPRTEGDQGQLWTKESWAELFEKVVKETEEGVAIHRGIIITAIGRKPL